MQLFLLLIVSKLLFPDKIFNIFRGENAGNQEVVFDSAEQDRLPAQQQGEGRDRDTQRGDQASTRIPGTKGKTPQCPLRIPPIPDVF